MTKAEKRGLGVSTDQCVYALNGIKGLFIEVGEKEGDIELTAIEFFGLGVAVGMIADQIAANESIY